MLAIIISVVGVYLYGYIKHCEEGKKKREEERIYNKEQRHHCTKKGDWE